MADHSGLAWQRIAREVAPTLPGTWVVRGGRGAKTVLIREPFDWAFSWVGVDRARVDDDPYLMAGVVTFVRPDPGFAASFGLRSDSSRHRPARVNMLADNAAEAVQRFILEDALPRMDPWTDHALAAIAEDGYLSADPGSRSVMIQAAGWRVVNDTGSPVEPARAAIAFLQHVEAPEEAAWYEAMIAAWERGGRASALQYLEDHRRASLTRLKLV